MHVDQSALLSCIYDTLDTFLSDHPGAEEAGIEVVRDHANDAIAVTAGGCEFMLVLLPYGSARRLGLAAPADRPFSRPEDGGLCL